MANIYYQNAESMTAQGTWQNVKKQYGKDWRISQLGGGNGNWLLTRPSDVLVDGVSCRSKVLEYYDRTRLTENLVQRFTKDVEQGKIDLNEFL